MGKNLGIEEFESLLDAREIGAICENMYVYIEMIEIHCMSNCTFLSKVCV